MNNINEQLIQNIKLIADEKRISRDTVTESLKDAISKAYVREYPETEVEVNIDLDTNSIEINKVLTVVKQYDDLNDYCEISVEDAKEKINSPQVGDKIREEVCFDELDRPVVAHILQIFKHNISNMANKQIFEEWKNRQNEVIYAEVEKIDSRSGFVIVNLENTFGFLSNQEKIPGEMLIPGQKYNFFIKEVKEQTKGWPIILSRADAGLVKYLITIQVPEIQEKIVEIKSIARVAGFKTKVALVSHQIGVEPMGTVIGARGGRIKAVSEQIHNEKIEVIEYDEDLTKYIVNVCSPADIVGVKIVEAIDETDRRKITIVCRQDKTALLIGKRGANVRLISQMLNANIEIKTVEDAAEEKISYEKIDMNSLRQRTFDRSFQRYRGNNANIIDNFNTDFSSSRNNNENDRNQDNRQKKQRNSILDGINKDDILGEFTKNNYSSDIADDIMSDDYDSDYSKYDE